jgi:hypothetical protein
MTLMMISSVLAPRYCAGAGAGAGAGSAGAGAGAGSAGAGSGAGAGAGSGAGAGAGSGAGAGAGSGAGAGAGSVVVFAGGVGLFAGPEPRYIQPSKTTRMAAATAISVFTLLFMDSILSELPPSSICGHGK